MTRKPFIDGVIEGVAMVCHEVNRAYCASQGDTSQQPWDLAPDWQRESAIKGVRFALEHPDAKPSDSHESWLEEKRRDGWTYGPVKDPDKKQHPCFVPYDQLPRSRKRRIISSSPSCARCWPALRSTHEP